MSGGDQANPKYEGSNNSNTTTTCFYPFLSPPLDSTTTTSSRVNEHTSSSSFLSPAAPRSCSRHHLQPTTQPIHHPTRIRHETSHPTCQIGLRIHNRKSKANLIHRSWNARPRRATPRGHRDRFAILRKETIGYQALGERQRCTMETTREAKGI